jgi:hypothetical protein
MNTLNCPICNGLWIKNYTDYDCKNCDITYYTDSPKSLYRYDFPNKQQILVFNFDFKSCKIINIKDNTNTQLPSTLSINITKEQLIKLLAFI